MVKRIGLTMRVSEAIGYQESRDCLAQDWYDFLQYALPDVRWVLIPNRGESVIDYVRQWDLQGFILTGGNDIGDAIIRDKTERAVLDYAISNHLPVFGVCRGLQMIQHYYEGSLRSCSTEAHVATTHSVCFVNTVEEGAKVGLTKQVNSYHTQAVSTEDLASPLQPLAITDEGWVEGLFHPTEQIVAVQWHPERNPPFSKLDRRLIRAVFGLRE